MSCDRFHKAAKDGLLDVLKEATRKDANAKDDDSMTPVLWTAFEGRLDALRLLCGRGGDPDKCDQFGNTALHLASAKGHMHCVDFLVKFGVNIYALDIDRHSAKDLAAINNRDDILRYLDSATANFEANEKKKAKAMREVAEKNCEKRMREYMKRQQKLENEHIDVSSKSVAGASNGNKSNMLSTLKQKIWSSQGNLHKPPRESAPAAAPCPSISGGSATTKFSELVSHASGSCGSVGSISSSAGTMQKKLRCQQHLHHSTNKADETGFKIGGIEPDGKRTVTSLIGVQRDSEVLYVGTFSSNEESSKRGKISDVFEVDEPSSDRERETTRLGYGTLSRSFSQPDILGDSLASTGRLGDEFAMQRPVGLFDRPMLGSISFRRSVTAALSQLQPDNYAELDMETGTTSTSTVTGRQAAATTTTKTRSNKQRSFLNISDSDSEGADGYSDDEQENRGSAIARFLTAWGLEEYLAVFQKQQIDLDTLMLLTEADLKSLALPLGPFRKLTCAIQERKNALANPGAMTDSRL
ncbi:ankyrin repeat and SAM domain-containing protein 4B [Anastrepha ludens]|uniref:ankyrin repeat and SAM domain-containing protein 4B n=1 Tax=Anastrepha ludens TaxID=28586 RepID=UPI0023B1F27F|nr:ankyrin repeat and SAM domain-containing protein 4B [Anastrepha ludens]XP_053962168.1 ankyrin repeat and SAM domain-containing protein 4B [Anastrepha ludens]XP_053962169.1 ankyrin repeat and SAM domain-containing protein 4B [Anastrepha ludens]XP_053962170.1 ankyrin repeat and SAM domain-containing protein 4B [Anastrepha ludens]XP_053962171.1 ankyrin repeat and SAM domain-containing protein 4B [Anastrepha ludens]XP_053962172.1 ankyrin repeat and SAM domain-containing protein 4B [Anastrepha l